MKSLNWWLMKIDRLSAWVLLFGMFAYFISGYGMTKGIITGDFARWLHLDFFPMIVLVTFVLHAGLAMRITFIRWRIWNKATMLVLIVVLTTFLAVFSYIELAYQQPVPVKQPTATTTSTVKTFTIQELANYNGQNGTPAYVAVDGVVYDLSSVFRNGVHRGHSAGQDLTAAFYSEHMIQILSKYPVVGKLAN
jgi:predicted heme/steroid binding protein